MNLNSNPSIYFYSISIAKIMLVYPLHKQGIPVKSEVPDLESQHFDFHLSTSSDQSFPNLTCRDSLFKSAKLVTIICSLFCNSHQCTILTGILWQRLRQLQFSGIRIYQALIIITHSFPCSSSEPVHSVMKGFGGKIEQTCNQRPYVKCKLERKMQLLTF